MRCRRAYVLAFPRRTLVCNLKMSTLLINPTASIETAGGRFKGLLTAMPPIGLALLAARLREQGREVAVYDAFIGRGGPEGVAHEVR